MVELLPSGMRMEMPCLRVPFLLEIRRGAAMGEIFRQLRISAQRAIDEIQARFGEWATEGEEMSSPRSGGFTNHKGGPMSVEIIINDIGRVFRINRNVFGSTLDFLLRMRKFFRRLAGISCGMYVDIYDIDAVSFLSFIIDNFNLFGSVEALLESLRPAKFSAVERSGLTNEDVVRCLFLLQHLRGGIRRLLSLNVLSVSVYRNNKHVDLVLENLFVELISEMQSNNLLSIQTFWLKNEQHTPISTDVEKQMHSRLRSILNSFYLLFDVFDLDDKDLRSVMDILLTFISSEKGVGVARFLGLNDLLICAVTTICGNRIPQNILMAICREKLNTRYRAESLDLQMDYIYTWIYKPHLSMLTSVHLSPIGRTSPREFQSPFSPPRTHKGRVTIELIEKENNASECERSLAYSPLSRRLSKGLRDEEFRSKQKLSFHD